MSGTDGEGCPTAATTTTPPEATTTSIPEPPETTVPAPVPTVAGTGETPVTGGTWSAWGGASTAGVDGHGRAPSTGGFPAELRALTDSVVRSSPRNTAVLVEAVERLVGTGTDHGEAVARVFGRFPVGGPAHYGHDWLYPRFGPGWRLHQGTDVFAAHGTPVRAPADGVVTTGEGGLGGLWVRVTEPDGTFWYLAHLSALAEGAIPGAEVSAGEVVGFVGDTGNARGTFPHLHIEVHPGGGRAVDSKPFLDQFLDDAEGALAGAGAAADPERGVEPGHTSSATVGPAPPTGRRSDAAPLAGREAATGPATALWVGPWALTGDHPWLAAGVRPPLPSGPGPASADDPVVVAAGLAALGMVIGVRRPRPRMQPGPVSGPPASP